MRGRGPGESGQALDVSVWPGGLEPVRKLLDRESLLAVGKEPSAENRALRLATDLTEAEFAGSAFVRNALILLGEIGGKETVWRTNDGRLNKAGVARMRTLMSWPGMEVTEQFRAGKSYYEQQVGELHLLRSVMNMAGLVEPAGLWFKLTPLGSEMLEPGRRGALQALLFRQAFWHRDLSKFVSGRPRNLPGWWPQGDIGVVLWSISAEAADWQNGATLTALCTVPDDTMPTAAHLGSGGNDVRAAHPRSAPLVRAGGISGTGGFVRCPVAQDRPLRPLPVVRCPTLPGARDGSLNEAYSEKPAASAPCCVRTRQAPGEPPAGSHTIAGLQDSLSLRVQFGVEGDPGVIGEEAQMAKIGRNQPCPCGSGRKYKHCCWHRDRAPHVHTTPAELSQGYRLAETDLDRLSNSVVSLIDEGRLDEADAVCEQLRTRYPEVHDWLMRKAMVCEARGETELAIEYCERTIAWMDAHPENFDPERREPFRKDIERLRGSLGGAC